MVLQFDYTAANLLDRIAGSDWSYFGGTEICAAAYLMEFGPDTTDAERAKLAVFLGDFISRGFEFRMSDVVEFCDGLPRHTPRHERHRIAVRLSTVILDSVYGY